MSVETAHPAAKKGFVTGSGEFRRNLARGNEILSRPPKKGQTGARRSMKVCCGSLRPYGAGGFTWDAFPGLRCAPSGAIFLLSLREGCGIREPCGIREGCEIRETYAIRERCGIWETYAIREGCGGWLLGENMNPLCQQNPLMRCARAVTSDSGEPMNPFCQQNPFLRLPR